MNAWHKEYAACNCKMNILVALSRSRRSSSSYTTSSRKYPLFPAPPTPFEAQPCSVATGEGYEGKWDAKAWEERSIAVTGIGLWVKGSIPGLDFGMCIFKGRAHKWLIERERETGESQKVNGGSDFNQRINPFSESKFAAICGICGNATRNSTHMYVRETEKLKHHCLAPNDS